MITWFIILSILLKTFSCSQSGSTEADLSLTDAEDFCSISSKVIDSREVYSSSNDSISPNQWPEVPCAFSEGDQALFKYIMDAIPHFRSATVYKVTTLQDLRYIFVVLKPHLGPLASFFRFEYDWNAIQDDCKSSEEFSEYNDFINKLN